MAELVLSRNAGGKPQARPSDGEIAALARRQHGVVTRGQLIALGLGEDAIDSRLGSGRLHRLHRGVYAPGHGLLPREGWWSAAVLRVGEDAVLSHRSAAELWAVRNSTDMRWDGSRAGGHGGRVDVSAPRSTRCPRGIRRHFGRLAADETTRRRGIPVTTLARTLFDIASEEPEKGFEGAIREAEYIHRFKLETLEGMLERHPGERGTGTIKACLRRLGHGPRGRTRKELENRFAAFLADTDLPRPELNVLLDLGEAVVEADCLWRSQRLIVELDGRQAHGTRVAFETDRERDRRIQASGWRVVRVTWRQLEDGPSLLKDLKRLLCASLPFPAI